jgi:hypothetical protein
VLAPFAVSIPDMAESLPSAVSALIHPDDEPYLRLLEHCARARRDLGLPCLSRAELEALLDRDGPLEDALPPNVIPLRGRRPRPARRRT